MFWKLALFPSLDKEAPNLAHTLDQPIPKSLSTTETVNLFRFAPENRFSPRVEQKNGF